MTDNEKLEILNRELEKHGLSMEMEDVHEFFYANRNSRTHSSFDDKTGKSYTYSGFLRPKMQKVKPSDFENSGYTNHDDNLMDWYFYNFGNDSRDDFVAQNIGKDSTKILKSYQSSTESLKSAFCNNNGELFGGDDGNHRLLILIINHFIERMSASSREKRDLVDEKYSMELPVSHMIDEKLADALGDKFDKMRKSVPAMALNFRELTFSLAHDHDYLLEHTQNDGEFKYNFNGEEFVGTEKQILENIQNDFETSNNSMMWTAGGVHYASSNNKIVSSKDPSKLRKYLLSHQVVDSKKESENNDYLEIKDLDTDTYRIKTPKITIDDFEKKKQVASFKNELMENWGNVISHKVWGGDKVIDDMIESCLDSSVNKPYPLVLNSRDYKNLSREEFERLKMVVDFEMKSIKNLTAENGDQIQS